MLPILSGNSNHPLMRLTKPFGVDIFCLGKKFLVYNMVSRNLKTKYRRSILGVFWTLLSPLSMAVMYYFVFKVILQIQIPYYLVFVLSGVLPWAFFSQSLGEGMDSIVGNGGLLTKVPLPAQIFPYVNVLTNLSTLLLSLPILICSILITGAPTGISIICLPFFYICLFLLAYFFALILGLLFVFFKDLRHLISILLQLWFYGTPVFYDEKMIPAKYSWILDLNPVGRIFTGIHKVTVHGIWPTLEEFAVLIGWVSVAFVGAALCQKHFSHELVENL